MSRSSAGFWARIAAFAAIAGCSAVHAQQQADRMVVDANTQTVGAVATAVGDAEPVFALLELRGGEAGFGGDILTRADFEATDAAETVQFVEVFVETGSLRHAYAPYVYFDGDDCAGNAWLSQAATRPAASLKAGIAGQGNKLYVARGERAEYVRVRSMLMDTQCRAFRHEVRVLPADYRLALDTVFAAPYHW